MGFCFFFVCLIQKEGEKNGGDNKVAPALAEKKDDVPVTAVYNIDCNCEGCDKKIKKALRHFNGKIHIQIHQPTSLYFPNCILLLFV